MAAHLQCGAPTKAQTPCKNGSRPCHIASHIEYWEEQREEQSGSSSWNTDPEADELADGLGKGLKISGGGNKTNTPVVPKFISKGSPKYAHRLALFAIPGSNGANSSDLAGTKKDAYEITSLLTGLGYRDSDSGIVGNMKKTAFLDYLACFFGERHTETDYYLLVYSGHGYSSGAWSVEKMICPQKQALLKEFDLSVTPKEVFALWKASKGCKGGARLLIVSDSCFSGAWVNAARSAQLSDVAVQSACSDDETTSDSNSFLRSLSKNNFKAHKFLDLSPMAYVGWEKEKRRCVLPLGYQGTIEFFNA